MASFLFTTCILCSAAACASLLLIVTRRARTKKQMPPGPPGLPLLGNVLQLTEQCWLSFTELKEQYGPIFTLDLAGQLVVVLNDLTTTADLTDRRSAIYSDRPRFVMAGELMTEGELLPITPYGSRWRKLRKAAHEGFNIHAVKAYRGLQEKDSYRLLRALLLNPREMGWDQDIESSLASTMISILYGVSPQDVQNRYDVVDYFNDFVHRLASQLSPGANLIDIFPGLKHLPYILSPWKIRGRRYLQYDTAVQRGLLNEAASEGAQHSFCTGLLDLVSRGELTDTEAARLSAIMHTGGVETTSGTIQVFILAMTLHPGTMRKAQNELDRVVGFGRPPSFDNFNELPYVRAIIREVMRWRTVGPLGLPKRCMQDNWYKGYLIPKGTMIVQNVWAMNRDPNHFTDADAFMPERFIDSEGRLKDAIADTHGHGHASFGSGRRICVGKELAEQSLFIIIATILWGSTISNAVDTDGNVTLPSKTDIVDNGVVVRPAPFACSITPRFPLVQTALNAVIEAQ